MSRSKLFAVVATAMLAMAALGPAAAGVAAAAGNTTGSNGLSIGVSQGADRVTISVTNNTTGASVANASVNITSDGNYSTEGVTDEDGIVAFDAPNETVNATIHVEANGSTATKTVTLRASDGDGPGFVPFGQKISAYVDGVVSNAGPNGPIGLLVASFATDNAPEDAGPDEGERGPPEDAGSDGEDRGPPEDAGPDEDDEDSEQEEGERGPPEDAGSDGEDRGPPEDAGPDDDDEDDKDEDDESDE